MKIRKSIMGSASARKSESDFINGWASTLFMGTTTGDMDAIKWQSETSRKSALNQTEHCVARSQYYPTLMTDIHERSAAMSTTDDPYEFEDYFLSQIMNRLLDMILNNETPFAYKQVKASRVMAAKGKTLATAPTKEALTDLINEYYFSKNYEITDDNRIHNTKNDKYMDGVAVEEKRGRWVFKRVEASTRSRRRPIKAATDEYMLSEVIGEKETIIDEWSSEYDGEPATSWDNIFDNVVDEFERYCDDEASSYGEDRTLKEKFDAGVLSEADMLSEFYDFIRFIDISDYDN